MVFMRMRWKQFGGHYHCRLFTTWNVPDGTYANCGSLVFDEREWPRVRARLETGAGVEFLEDAK